MKPHILIWVRRCLCAAVLLAVVFALANARDDARATTEMTTRQRLSIDIILTAALVGASIAAEVMLQKVVEVRPLYRQRQRHIEELERTTRKTVNVRTRVTGVSTNCESTADRRARLDAAFRESYENARTGIPTLPGPPDVMEGS